MTKLKKTIFKLPETQKKMIEESEVIKNLFLSPADFYRRAVDEKLERLGLLRTGIYNGEIKKGEKPK